MNSRTRGTRYLHAKKKAEASAINFFLKYDASKRFLNSWETNVVNLIFRASTWIDTSKKSYKTMKEKADIPTNIKNQQHYR